jgi:hypothetical protein
VKRHSIHIGCLLLSAHSNRNDVTQLQALVDDLLAKIEELILLRPIRAGER